MITNNLVLLLSILANFIIQDNAAPAQKILAQTIPAVRRLSTSNTPKAPGASIILSKVTADSATVESHAEPNEQISTQEHSAVEKSDNVPKTKNNEQVPFESLSKHPAWRPYDEYRRTPDRSRKEVMGFGAYSTPPTWRAYDQYINKGSPSTNTTNPNDKLSETDGDSSSSSSSDDDIPFASKRQLWRPTDGDLNESDQPLLAETNGRTKHVPSSLTDDDSKLQTWRPFDEHRTTSSPSPSDRNNQLPSEKSDRPTTDVTIFEDVDSELQTWRPFDEHRTTSSPPSSNANNQTPSEKSYRPTDITIFMDGDSERLSWRPYEEHDTTAPRESIKESFSETNNLPTEVPISRDDNSELHSWRPFDDHHTSRTVPLNSNNKPPLERNDELVDDSEHDSQLHSWMPYEEHDPTPSNQNNLTPSEKSYRPTENVTIFMDGDSERLSWRLDEPDPPSELVNEQPSGKNIRPTEVKDEDLELDSHKPFDEKHTTHSTARTESENLPHLEDSDRPTKDVTSSKDDGELQSWRPHDEYRRTPDDDAAPPKPSNQPPTYAASRFNYGHKREQ